MSKTIYSKDHKYLVLKLKEARIECGYSQSRVSMLIRKTQSYVSKIESGQRRIDIHQLNMFSKIYKKSLDYFFEK